jgi:hypothetical protein
VLKHFEARAALYKKCVDEDGGSILEFRTNGIISVQY